jgi:hypothetical protein
MQGVVDLWGCVGVITASDLIPHEDAVRIIRRISIRRRTPFFVESLSW